MQPQSQDCLNRIQIKNIPAFCKRHGKRIEHVILGTQNVDGALLCKECFQQKLDNQDTMHYNQFQNSQIEERYNSLKNFLLEKELFLNLKSRLYTNLDNYFNSVRRQIDQLRGYLEIWERDLNQSADKYIVIDFNEEFKDSFQKNQEIEKSMKIINEMYFKNTKFVFQNLISQKDLRQCLETLNEIAIRINNKEVINSFLKLQPVVSDDYLQLPQKDMACAIKINQTQLITSSEKDIKIYKLNEGKFQLQQQLGGHAGKVQCLVENKECDWMASGDSQGVLIIWRLESKGSWKRILNQKKHKQIDGLLLSESEQELISYGGTEILVWQVNIDTKISNYMLKNEKGDVLAATYNNSGTLLITSHFKVIQLWKRKEDQTWHSVNLVETQHTVLKVCCLSDSSIWCQVKGVSSIRLFQIFSNKLKQFYEQKFNNEIDDESLFPTIFNREKRVIVQKHNRFVYVIKWQLDGKFEIKKIIDCGCSIVYGSLSNDAKLLAIWSQERKMHHIYKIKYEK